MLGAFLLLSIFLFSGFVSAATLNVVPFELSVDDSTNFGSSANEAVGFDVDITLNELFAGEGLQYEYTVLSGGTFDGSAPVSAVIDLSDGRHIVLFPGWGSRTGIHTLTFSDTSATATADSGNVPVDFVVYGTDWVKIESSPGSYPAWTELNSVLTTVDGTEVVTGLAIQHQAANTGQTDRVESMLINSVAYYGSIQAAIDAAGDGDTINVAAGTYSEPIQQLAACGNEKASLCIDKPLTLHGESGAVLDGTGLVGSAIALLRDGNPISGVTIEGFVIKNYVNPSGQGGVGSGVIAWNTNASNIIVQDNSFEDLGWNGVLVGSDDDSVQSGWTVQNNVIDNAAYAGIELTNVVDSQVLGNEIIVSNGNWDAGDSGVGIEVAVRDHGTGVTAGNNIVVEGNTLTSGDGRAAINILSRAYTSDSNALLTGVTVHDNTITGTGTRGVSVVAEQRNGGSSTVSNLNIDHNTITGNDVGIHFGDINGEVQDGTYSTIDILNNIISGNTHLGIENAVATLVVNAENNFWGSVTGPKHISNFFGTGDSVSDNVNFVPWYQDADLTIIANDITVTIPAGTVVTGSLGWDGTTINAPTILTAATAVPSLPTGGTFTLAISKVIEVGFSGESLTFDQAVKILIPGEAGKSVGYVSGNVFTPIANVCNSETDSSNIVDNGECHFDDGTDLTIWTKHFTEFLTYTFVPFDNTPSNEGSGGGGTFVGGGGATTAPTPTAAVPTAPAPAAPTPTAPTGGFLGGITGAAIGALGTGGTVFVLIFIVLVVVLAVLAARQSRLETKKAKKE